VSGGSYDYLCYAEPDEYPQKLHDFERMADRLARLGFHDPSVETFALIGDIRSFRARMEATKKRLADVWRAVEWYDSCDYGLDQVGEAVAKYRGGGA